MIPKIIHYCWFGPGKMTKLEKRCIASWKKVLPDYAIKCWDESNFDINYNNFTKDAYKAGKFAFVSDVARLHAIYHVGGIYMDTDMFMLKSLDQFLIHPFFIGHYRPGELAVGIFGCEKGNHVTEILLKAYQRIKFDQQNLHTIPNHFDLVVDQEHLHDKMVIYSPEFFYPLPFEKKNENYEKYITTNTMAVHLWNHSWKDEFSSLKNFDFMASISLHFKNVFSCNAEFKSANYFKRYYKSLYYNFKRYLYNVFKK